MKILWRSYENKFQYRIQSSHVPENGKLQPRQVVTMYVNNNVNNKYSFTIVILTWASVQETLFSYFYC